MAMLESHPSSSTCRPSSSTANPTRWKYDVFLSFRGPDTRKGITVEICDRLQIRGIRAFMDDRDLEPGDSISPTLIAAIQESRFAVVILSSDYASSTWCLEELEKIWECMKNEDRIFPLFYQVDPTEVRYQNKGRFKEAFYKHETSGRNKPETVKKWRAALKEVADISGWSTNDFKTHKELVNKIMEFLGSKVPPDAIISTDDFHAYEVTTIAMAEVKEALRDEEVTVVGVYGMGGVGKTIMVKHIAEETRRNGTFNYWIMATISQNPVLNKIQSTLADFLGIILGEETEEGRAARLHTEIMRRGNLLIILDDLWKVIELSKIGIPCPKALQNRNSKIVLTTRRRNVCHAMECQRKITLNSLSEEDSWDLFVRKARRPFDMHTFEVAARKVAKECGGLPIALITVAKALGDKDLAEWKRAANRLEKSQTANYDDEGEAFKCIKLSYDYLKYKDYKSFFLLCCLFPEDYDIHIEDLFRYGIGLELFQDAETLGEVKDRADSLATHLKNSSLLLDGATDKHVRLHDVVRDAAVQITQSEQRRFLVKAGCGLKDWSHQLHEDYSAISLMENKISKLPGYLVCPNLQILILSNNSFITEIPETFFQSPNGLRVLDLSYTTKISLLPQSFGLLTNLRALYLDGCEHLIIDSSKLGKLKKLEILSMRNLRLKLSVKLRGLTNLRIFDNTCGNIARISPGVISGWQNLEELYIKGFSNWGSKGFSNWGSRANASFKEVTNLSKLRVLEATISNPGCIPMNVKFIPNWVEFDITICGSESDILMLDGKHSVFLRSISLYRLELSKNSPLPKWFHNVIIKIVDNLRWYKFKSSICTLLESEHVGLQGLKQLHISDQWNMDEGFMEVGCKETWVSEKPVLENLEELIMEEVVYRQFSEAVEYLPPGSLFNLKILKVVKCSVGTVLPSKMLQMLQNLEEIVGYFIRSKFLFGYVDSVPVKLKKIDLSWCDIAHICGGPVPPTMFQNLQTLRVTNCKSLKGSLFSHDVSQCLSQLGSLILDSCILLEKIVEAGNKKTVLPKLRQLSIVALPLLYYESDGFDIECPSLEKLWVEFCPKFTATSDDFHSKKQVKLDRYI